MLLLRRLASAFSKQPITLYLAISKWTFPTELEIYNAFIKAGVPEADAKAAVESINKEIDKRYAEQAVQVFTKNDGEELKAEIIRWSITTIFATGGSFAVLPKLLYLQGAGSSRISFPLLLSVST